MSDPFILGRLTVYKPSQNYYTLADGLAGTQIQITEFHMVELMRHVATLLSPEQLADVAEKIAIVMEENDALGE